MCQKPHLAATLAMVTICSGALCREGMAYAGRFVEHYGAGSVQRFDDVSRRIAGSLEEAHSVAQRNLQPARDSVIRLRPAGESQVHAEGSTASEFGTAHQRCGEILIALEGARGDEAHAACVDQCRNIVCVGKPHQSAP